MFISAGLNKYWLSKYVFINVEFSEVIDWVGVWQNMNVQQHRFWTCVNGYIVVPLSVSFFVFMLLMMCSKQKTHVCPNLSMQYSVYVTSLSPPPTPPPPPPPEKKKSEKKINHTHNNNNSQTTTPELFMELQPFCLELIACPSYRYLWLISSDRLVRSLTPPLLRIQRLSCFRPGVI